MPTKTKTPASGCPQGRVTMGWQAEMQWIQEHGHDYPGQWIAVDGDRLIAHGSDAQQVFAEVDRVAVVDPTFRHFLCVPGVKHRYEMAVSSHAAGGVWDPIRSPDDMGLEHAWVHLV
jgi:hypothetical protein